MKRTLTVLAAMGLVATLGLVGPLGAASGNKYESTTRDAEDDCQGPDDTGDGSLLVSITGPEKLWPPNHKYVPVSVIATDDDGDDVALETEGTHDQYAEDGSEMNGAGNTGDDVSPAAAADMGSGSATTTHEVRAERAGPDQDGRTYTITYEAETSGGDMCIGSFDIFVPHDMRGGADWK